jgi:hypothetical protein
LEPCCRFDACKVSDGLLVFLIVEEKKHKLPELKTGLDEADSLVCVVLNHSFNSWLRCSLSNSHEGDIIAGFNSHANPSLKIA